MTIAFISDDHKYGVLLGSFLSRAKAISLRQVSGDLLFLDSGEIDLGTDWLFEWERADSGCYARRQQARLLSIVGYRMSVPVETARG